MRTQDPILDLLGIGFGPAAIAVATAIEDAIEAQPADTHRLSVRFLERAPNAAWQPSMLLPGTDIQHHFLRDYATPRNPRSRFTFPGYLLDTGRFFQFTLLGGFVSRQEWSEYTQWVADGLSLPVRYRTEVTEVRPVLQAGRVVAAEVIGTDLGTGEQCSYTARNVLVSVGHSPYVPEMFAPHVGERLFHSAAYLPRIAAAKEKPQSIAVIGAGQNAGEIILHLAGSLPEAHIHSLARNSGFRMYNLGHFSNEAYFPAETEYFYALSTEQRRKVFNEVHSTNYAAVDPELSTAMYRAAYDDHHWGAGRLHFRKRTAVVACEPTPGGGYRLTLREVNTGEVETLSVDMIILCTGYREPKLPAMLNPLLDYVDRDAAGDPVVGRAFRLGVTADCELGVYLNGITEWRHGINSATSFSTMAIKAAEILHDVEEHLRASSNGHRAGASALSSMPGNALA